MLLLCLITISFSSAQSQNISLGSSLSPTPNGRGLSYWLSPSGNFAFGFYPLKDPQQFLVGIWMPKTLEKVLVWSANRNGPPFSVGSFVTLSRNGGLILNNSQAQLEPIHLNSLPASSASMLDDGNFVLYNSDSRAIWESFDSPTDTILSGQTLSTKLSSSVSETNHSTGKYQLIMQTDGNLVLYYLVDGARTILTPANAYWFTRTQGKGDAVTLNLAQDGHMYLLDSTGSNIKNITNSQDRRSIYRARLEPGGNFELFLQNLEGNGSSLVWSAANDPCEVYGLCGFNSYCTLMDVTPTCLCPPGFVLIDPNGNSQGCQRNFTGEDDCRVKEGIQGCMMFPMENINWADNAFDILSASEEECEQACLDDRACMAILFENNQCKKQPLPLRYMKRITGSSVKAFIKTAGQNSSAGINGRNKGEHQKILLIIGLILMAFSIILVLISSFLYYNSRVGRHYQKLMKQVKNAPNEVNLRSFSYSELEKATHRFNQELGQGAFGTVYLGSLPCNTKVAVKKLEKVIEEGEREFQTEMNVIGKTHHRNLVRLFGYCNEGSHRFLVYEFMSNGSLASHLFKTESRPDWFQRVGITLDIARGLLYLHEECVTQIIHCDIKPQNILLDDFQTAKISDFGLAKILKPEQTRTYTGVRGTRGYVAPEWYKNQSITVKADVYSFGIMLVEIICCRKAIESGAPEDEVVLIDWVYNCFEAGELEKLERVAETEGVENKRLERMVMVGLWCVQDDPALRPSMKKVVLMLEGTVDIPRPPSPSSFISSS
ncbi:G-type lectin S-receptor-like serine/threonine-protein kinase LECRK2 [Amborella trichopoda]|uniref:Receptor-like serine/threonine-protein kinase n=1 Tax=Amborella trichopoda TaxID=13333 RepID=U5D6T5_AMBTC|nr:G-type lectin S-receptor-like serine/threonine-protein kinase LECRK2 [Amborella trichopoda]ERN16048.1 hypothetical protein AMTR_s00030p00115530 [Amborella trichopoda]|eukprot:XP_020529406.1 G-type lectin S-receptor-like serine/threonine-protein kinase LECRK2 [Amborella trichopoda]